MDNPPYAAYNDNLESVERLERDRMFIVRSASGVPIRLTSERWEHITRRHVEMVRLREQVLRTITQPDFVQQGDEGTLLAVRRLTDAPLAGKFVVVVYREVGPDDGFVLTAYLTRRPAPWREIVWKP